MAKKNQFILEQDETIEQNFKGDFKAESETGYNFVNGTITLTNKRIHLESYAMLNQAIVDVYYKDIENMKKYNTLFIMPFRIKISTTKGVVVLNIFKRDERFVLISELLEKTKAIYNRQISNEKCSGWR